MKRILVSLLAFVMLFSFVSCSGGIAVTETGETNDAPEVTVTETGDVQVFTKKTLNPMSEMPDYTLPAGSSTDQIRAMVVQAQRDELSVRWICPEDYTVEKAKSGYIDSFALKKNTLYAGIPYTVGGCGLLSWLQYYDPETGNMLTDGKTIAEELGNACTISVQWGWSSVLSGVTWSNNFQIVEANGCLPVGPYTYDKTMKNLDYTSTHDICEQNGEQIMYQSYAAALPADGIVTYERNANSNHMMMFIEKPNVVYKADGTIDGEKSTVAFQDQAPSYALETRDGETVTSFGHLRREFTFAQLYAARYIPFTHAELIGQKPYEGLQYTFLKSDGSKVTSFDDFGSATIESSHSIITVTATVTDKDGKEVGSIKRITGKDRFNANAALTYTAASLPRANAFKNNLKKGETYTYSLSALMATGATVDLASFQFTY